MGDDVWGHALALARQPARFDDPAAGALVCEWLLSRGDLPSAIRDEVSRLLMPFTRPLEALCPGVRVAPLAIPVEHGWTCFNPSVAAAGAGYRAIVRSSNYRLVDGRYHSRGPVRTANYLVDLAPDLAVRSQVLLADETDPAGRFEFRVRGYEDCRLFAWDGRWWASATARDRNEAGVNQQALLEIGDHSLTNLRLLSDWRDGVAEKNWMPLVDAAGLNFVYSCHPTVVLRFDPVKGGVDLRAQRPAPPLARGFRGGSQAIRVDGGWLALIHETIFLPAPRRAYRHRFVRFDDAFRLAAVSPPFWFLEEGVEYATGLALRDGALVASFGRADRDAYLATLPLAEAEGLLRPPLDGDAVAFAEVAREAGIAPPTVPVIAAAPTPRTTPAGVSPGRRAGVTPPVPTIVSTTLSGGSRDQIADALHSVVDWVDACLLIDTGIADDTIELARAVAGDKLIVRAFPWVDDFAAARNFALQAATELGFDWALTLDADERIDLRGLDVRAALAESTTGLLHVRNRDGAYVKERFFRLPLRGRFVGPTHEAFVGPRRAKELPRARFWELPKSPEALQRKLERDLAVLTRHSAANPTDPRWHYYLGDTLANLGRNADAIAAFRDCWSLDGWPEESAWAMYRAAECWLKLGDARAAVAACADGLTRRPDAAELAWLAAYAEWQGHRPERAVAWARISIALGCVEGLCARRGGFSHPPGRYEGPYDVLRFALKQVGDPAAAEEAERAFHCAQALREAAAGAPD